MTKYHATAITPASLVAMLRRYNTAMKLIFIGSSLWIIYLMRVHRVIKQTYDASEDTFRVLFLLAPSAVLALLINQKHNSPVEVRAPTRRFHR